MAHFAKLDENNIVTKIVVVKNSILLNEDNTESEEKGKQFLNELFGTSSWAQTSWNRNIRKNYAAVGYKYDSTRDAFVPPQPYSSWTLNETSCLWEAPVALPNDADSVAYVWDETTAQWVTE